MRASPQIHLLTEIHRLERPEAQRAAFRRAMADLAAMVAEQRPVPLEGLDPNALGASIAVAMQEGFLDDLSFIAAPAAAVALYQLASVLPKGDARSRLGAKVVDRLHHGDAHTFAALGAALAMGTREPFSGADLWSRVALVLELPSRERTAADALSLALIARPQLMREWVLQPSSAALPGRRMSARILERAAREVVRLCRQGDEAALQVFANEELMAAWKRLLGDRESLVWRHVAVARGLLATVDPRFDEEVQHHLDPSLSPTEWRRAVVSEAAAVSGRPEEGLRRCRAILRGPLVERDRGLPGAMIFGLAPTAETEPKAAEELLLALVEQGGDYALETLVEHLRDGGDHLRAACEFARARLTETLAESDMNPGRRYSLVTWQAQLDTELAAQGCVSLRPVLEDTPLPTALDGALITFAKEGPAEAARRAEHVLQMAETRVEQLAHLSGADALPALWELDNALLQTAALQHLLRLGEDPQANHLRLEALRDRLHRQLIAGEREVAGPDAIFMLHMRRLVSMLHMVDADSAVEPMRQRRRQLDTVRTLLMRVPQEAKTTLGRVLCATLARAFDALVREGVFEMSDILLMSALYVRSDSGVRTLSEASMDPLLEKSLFAYSAMVEASERLTSDPTTVPNALARLDDVVRAIPVASSPRVEALRRATHALHTALRGLEGAHSLSSLCGGSEPVAMLAQGVHMVGQLSAGAIRRFSSVSRGSGASAAVQHLVELSVAIEAQVSGGDPVPFDTLYPPLFSALADELPRALVLIVRLLLEPLRRLPVQGEAGQPRARVAPARRFPAWLPPSRMLGGFFVIDTLGEGAVGSVFVATRIEDRGKPNAPRFALKVPTYDGQAAGALSEDEFLALFRKEAGALLALPDDHPNLASFVTFDAGARPKPLLVMELVQGPSMARLLSLGRLDVGHALRLLVGVSEGLTAMHELGIGHLDVKPGNIIVRESDKGDERAVLVDFGLSGRAIRAGCATAAYGAPEVWGLLPEHNFSDPRPADVYALACTVYEVLTGRDLFSGNDDIAVVSAHISHDGEPKGLSLLCEQPQLMPLVELLSGALRRDPRQRIDAPAFTRGLRELVGELGALSWPLLPRKAHRAA